MTEVAVIGAGISGLALAHHLSKLGAQVQVYEAAARPGGTLYTEHIHGFRVEWGPNGFLDNKPSTLELMRELGLESQCIQASDATSRRYLFADDRLHALPSSPSAFLFGSVLAPLARIRVLLEPFVPRRTSPDTESVADFARRRLGSGAAKRLIDPMVSGIHAADPERLELHAAFPRLASLEAEYGSLIRGALALARARKKSGDSQGAEDARSGGPGGQLHSFRDGLDTIIHALADQTQHLHCDCAIGSLSTAEGRWTVQGQAPTFDAVVLATPPRHAAPLVQSLDSDLSGHLEAIDSAGVAVVALGFHRSALAHPLDGFGYLVPGGDPVLGCLWSSSVWTDHRAPRDHVLVRCLVGGRRHPEYLDRNDTELLDHVRKHLDPVLGITGEPVVTRVIRQRLGIPQYEMGHVDRLAAIDSCLTRIPGLYLTGNGYRGIGLNDCTAEAARLATVIMSDLETRSSAATA